MTENTKARKANAGKRSIVIRKKEVEHHFELLAFQYYPALVKASAV